MKAVTFNNLEDAFRFKSELMQGGMKLPVKIVASNDYTQFDVVFPGDDE